MRNIVKPAFQSVRQTYLLNNFVFSSSGCSELLIWSTEMCWMINVMNHISTIRCETESHLYTGKLSTTVFRTCSAQLQICKSE